MYLMFMTMSMCRYGECKMEELNSAFAHNIKVAFSLKDIFAGKKTRLKNGAEEEAYFKSRVAQVRSYYRV